MSGFAARIKEHPIITGVLGVAAVLAAVSTLTDWAKDIYVFVAPPPIRAAVTDFRRQDGQLDVNVAVEVEAPMGTYAWVCAAQGAGPVDVLPIARSTSLRFSVPEGTASTLVYVQISNSDLIEIPIDLYTGTAKDGQIIDPEAQQCG